MAKNEDKTVHTTSKTLINTVGNVRELVNTLLHYNPATTPITDIQIRWLLNSPLDSIIKNIIFFEMTYAAVKESVKHHAIQKLLEKIGLKELSKRYHEWLQAREKAQEKSVPVPELMLEFERFRVNPAPVAPTQQKKTELNLRLTDLLAALGLLKDEIKKLFVKHHQLIQNLIILNTSHVNTVQTLAHELRVELQPEHIITFLPEVHDSYHSALSFQDQIRALGRIIDVDNAANNAITAVNQFLNSTALRTALTAYEDGIGMLNIEFSMLSEQMIACQLREHELMSEIHEVQNLINQAQLAEPQPTGLRPQFDEAPAFSANDIQQLLRSFRPHESSPKNVTEDDQPIPGITMAAPAA